MRRWLRVLLLGLLLCAAGCPRQLDVPEPPDGVQRCSRMEDCNVARCGVLRACVGGLCEAVDAGTVVVPCLDAGGPPGDASMPGGDAAAADGAP